MVSLKSLIQFFKEEWIRFKNFINAEKQRKAFVEYWKNYVPQYSRRTEAEHTACRRRATTSPSVCQHRKGFHRRPRSVVKDYNVSFHRFIDGTERIRCLSCGKKWFPSDADWQQALNMVEDSTNTRTASETPYWRSESEEYGTFADIKKVYPTWEGRADLITHYQAAQSNSKEK
jgi:hypothetical protein